MKHRQVIRGMLLGPACLPGLCIAGALHGTVLLEGAAPAPKKMPVTIDQYLCGKEKDAEDLIVSPRGEISNAVIWLENPPPRGAWPAGAEKVAIDQNGCAFVPRVSVVPVGGTVDFLNSDRLLHNIHATPRLNASFNRTQPKNRTIPITLSKAEIIRVDCDLHAWMTAWVVVAPHPYHAVTKADGRFTFDDLPAGAYRLRVWHERLGTLERDVQVPEKADAAMKVEMKLR